MSFKFTIRCQLYGFGKYGKFGLDLTYSLLKQQRSPGSDSAKTTLSLPNPAPGQPWVRRASFDLVSVRLQRSDSSQDKRQYPYTTLHQGSLGLREYETYTLRVPRDNQYSQRSKS